MKKKKKFTKLSHRVQRLASKYIAEETRTGKYKPAQAKAIGINRARKYAKKNPLPKRK